MIRQIFYISDVVAGSSDRTVPAILAASRRNNWRLDITGLLMCSGRHFAQVLEGRRESLEALITKLQADPRHAGIRVLFEGEGAARRYGDWSMGFLYNESIGHALDSLAASPTVSEDEVQDLLLSLRPDTVMGTL